MSTYKNAYQILTDVRLGLDEYSSGYLQGTDTTGHYSNEYLTKKINEAVRYLYAILFKRVPHEFLEETSLTGVNSVFTLPADFGKLIYFKDDNGYRVYPIGVSQFKTRDSDGSDRHYYRKSNTLVLDKTGVTSTYTLYYQRKCRDVHMGQASAGAATSMTLSSTYAPKVADYYNGMTVENITKDWVDTIDDYSAARVATISETAAASDWYGIVPDIPEPFHELIAPKTILAVRNEFPKVKRKPTRNDLNEFAEQLAFALNAFASADGDTPIDELFANYDDYGVAGIIVDD